MKPAPRHDARSWDTIATPLDPKRARSMISTPSGRTMLPARTKSISLTITPPSRHPGRTEPPGPGQLWLASDVLRFESETSRIRRDYLETRKEVQAAGRGHALRHRGPTRAALEANLRTAIRDRTLEAWSVADNATATIPDADLGRNRRHDPGSPAPHPLQRWTRLYFFATNLNGTEELFADQPLLEGKNLLGMRDLEKTSPSSKI